MTRDTFREKGTARGRWREKYSDSPMIVALVFASRVPYVKGNDV